MITRRQRRRRTFHLQRKKYDMAETATETPEHQNCIDRLTTSENDRMTAFSDLVYGGFLDGSKFLSSEGKKEINEGNHKRATMFFEAEEKLSGVAMPTCNAAALAAHFNGQWEDEDQEYWLGRLKEEVQELEDSLAGEHEDPPGHELMQIASIAINWLGLEMKGHFHDEA